MKYPACVLGLMLAGAAMLHGREIPRALPEGALPRDARLEPLRTLDDTTRFVPPPTLALWQARAGRVRRQILVSQGLWPMPGKSPLHAVIYGRVDRPEYTVEKVFFESLPGFYVTGNLYRPKGRSGRLPGILCPHGHWPDGRFMDIGEDGVLKEIAQGAERFEEGGRSLLQARCVQLARMGCVVFIYDMLGYADSQQITIAHPHGDSLVRARPAMNTLENWGFFSAQAEAHLQSVMGLQTWDSIRSLDFLLSLPDVDPERIGCTGASGGATQTILLAAVDDRVKVAFPAVMVSGDMQGGCVCENASDLRIGTNNLEIAALFAPKPLGMTSADDWTKDMPRKGFPELRQLYRLYGAEENVALTSLPQFGHNYNAVSRMAMYSWFNRHFRLGLREPVVERDYRRLSREEMTVWGPDRPAPPGGPDFERHLLKEMTADAARQLEALQRRPEEYRQTVGSALDVLIGRNLAEVGTVAWNPMRDDRLDGYAESVGLLDNVSHKEEVPMILLRPERWNGDFVIWLEPGGKASLFERSPAPQLRPEIRSLLGHGATVVGADLFMEGEFLPYGRPLERTRTVENPREAPAYTFCYNSSLFAQRVQDILTIVKFARQRAPAGARIILAGLNGSGPLVAAAVPQAQGAVTGAVLAAQGFRFSRLQDVSDANFLPGGARYGDLPGMLALAGPTRIIQAEDRQAEPAASVLELLR